MSTQAEDLAAWVRLEQTSGVGAIIARKLLTEFGLPHNIFAAGYGRLQKLVPDRIAQALTQQPDETAQLQIEKALAWAQVPDNHLLTLADDAYPRALLDIPDPPILLYVKGRLALLAQPALAIVGSRNATAQGAANAENFAKALSQAGLTIVSGLALGVDAGAHRGGLQGAGRTIAVIGTGADIVYPARNHALAHQIAEEGCIVSEYPLGTPAIAANFPRRNRIISGLARGVLVIEAAAQSGSLITARVGAEQGKEVFAIPGSIHSPLSKGCHLLIKQGAKLVESAQDVLEELRLSYPAAAKPIPTAPNAPPSTSHPLLQTIGFDPVSIDLLAERTQISAAELNAQLLTLELEGKVERLNDGQYRKIS
ncbi:MAG: DNA-protecting protein DprA [Oxalobacter sp.]|nr:MAG: DNA-protecting protein DprA [Oxalobacter sp.]